MGYVEDVIVDDDDWHCRQLMINGELRLSGRRAFVPTEWLGELHADEHRILAPVPRARIASAAEQPATRSLDVSAGSPGAPHEPTSTAGADTPRAFSGSPQAAFWAQAAAWKERSTRGLKAALQRTLHGR